MNLILIIVFISFSVVSQAANGKPLASEYADDVITYLWWALGLMGSFAALISSCTGVWILQRVLQHDKDIAIIKTKCAIHDKDEDSNRLPCRD